MAQEIEAKYPVDDPLAVQARLEASGGRPISRVLESNRVFDTRERTLAAADCGLRIRTTLDLNTAEQSTATLTYKGPRTASSVKARDEIETRITDPTAIAEILNRLGFFETVLYEKRRATWRLDDCEVCVDELPRLGWFVEIEGPSAAAVENARLRLGLHTPPLRQTYVEMAATRGQSTADGRNLLLFND